jgi:DNA-binding NarL/FixJ family response regulator
VRVLIADDQALIREGLATLLATIEGVDVVATASDGDEAVAGVADLDPDVVLMDLRMPNVDGVEATRRIRLRHPRTQVVVLTTYADDESIVGALRAGALGYLTKDAGRAEIVRALEAATSGQAVLDAAVQGRLVGIAATPAPEGASLPDGLTAREGEVLALVAGGLSNAEIGERLFVSRATVKSHVNHLLAKTGCRDRPQLIAYAHEHGLSPRGWASRWGRDRPTPSAR